MCRWTSLFALVVVAIATGAMAADLEVSSDVVAAEIVVSGAAGSFGGASPLQLTSLPAGRYDIELFAHGRSLGHRPVDVGYDARLRGSLSSRWFLSTLVPGLGQWRDEGWREAWAPAAGALLPAARALHFGRTSADYEARARSLGEYDSADDAVLDERDRALADANFARETREDYLRLFSYMHVGNILTASVRRGGVQFHRTREGKIQVLHRPVRPPAAVLLSSVWPGLGQLRAGHRQRAQIWHLTVLAWGTTMVELQRSVDQARRDRNILLATAGPGDPGFEQNASALSGEIEDARHLRNNVAILGAAIWLANLFDAAFSAGSPPVDSDASLAGQLPERGGWAVEPGWLGDAPGLVASRSF